MVRTIPGSLVASLVAAAAMAAAVLIGAACSGGGGGGSAKFGDTECAECIGDACAAEIAACSVLSDCGEAIECVLDCPVDENALDLECAQSDCADLVTTSAGGTAFTAAVDCYLAESPTSGSCGSPCAPPTE